LKNRTA